jgi:hypothetical protein
VPSHIKIGECAVFSGDGFAPLTSVAISDNGVGAGTAQANASGEFSKQLCYTSEAKRGRHDLAGTGRGAQGDTLTVTAVLIVEGARQSANNPSTTPGGAASGPGGGTTATNGSLAPPGSSVIGGTSGAVAEPPAEPQQGGVVPVDSSTSGWRLLALGAAGLGFAFLASLLLLLISRRRRRAEGDEGWSLDAAVPA